MNKLYILLIALILSVNVFGQSPQKMSYQAIVRDAGSELITNSTIGIKISVLQGNILGTAVYVETHSPTTNINGLVSIEIGNGSVVFGDFSEIDWSAGPYFIKTSTDPNGDTNYTITGTSQLLSVPYALYAETAGNAGVDGQDGVDGNDGPTGAIGPKGADGINGIDGINGLDGTNGRNGIDGDDGVRGAVGRTGVQGPKGVDGTNGIDGINGKDGATGAVGQTGIQGPKGADGTNGIDGINGQDGINGTNGIVGPEGPQGIPGSVGIPSGGTEGQVLTIVGGVPTWSSPCSKIFYADTDNDGYGDANDVLIACSTPTGYVTNNNDCDDNDPIINQAVIWYLGVDDDSDTFIGSVISVVACVNPGGYSVTIPSITDCDDTDPNEFPAQTWYLDTDSDGYGASSIVSCDRPINGFLLAELTGTGTDDCDDTDPNEFPGQTWYLDVDSDGYGLSSSWFDFSIVSCDRPANGFLLAELTGINDCNDTDPNEFPGQTWYIDSDSDGYGGSSIISCNRPANGFLLAELTGTGSDDCDDTDPIITNANQTWYIDADGDGYGGTSVVSCLRPSNGFLLAELTGTGIDDCDDTDPIKFPGQIWYLDIDNDGYGGQRVVSCNRPNAYAFLISQLIGIDDCNDANPAINPGALEIGGNNIDDNCDGFSSDAPVVIGQFIHGGIVFWIDPLDNTHGLVCSIKNMHERNLFDLEPWEDTDYKSVATGATGTTIGTGASNTAIISATLFDAGVAAKMAKDYRGGGYRDWFLPSKDALNEIYINRAFISLFSLANGGAILNTENVIDIVFSRYYSSSEASSSEAWVQDFTTGKQVKLLKGSSSFVRAVRAF